MNINELLNDESAAMHYEDMCRCLHGRGKDEKRARAYLWMVIERALAMAGSPVNSADKVLFHAIAEAKPQDTDRPEAGERPAPFDADAEWAKVIGKVRDNGQAILDQVAEVTIPLHPNLNASEWPWRFQNEGIQVPAPIVTNLGLCWMNLSGGMVVG